MYLFNKLNKIIIIKVCDFEEKTYEGNIMVNKIKINFFLRQNRSFQAKHKCKL